MNSPFTLDDLEELSYALDNLIQDKRDYCAHEEETADHIARLETLKLKVAALMVANA